MSAEAASKLLYLDSSALVKLVIEEAESAALLTALAAWPERCSSELAVVEVERAARRASLDPADLERARTVLAGLHLLRLDREVLTLAARLEPTTLRSLDALHLATALQLGEDLGAFAAYDGGLAEAARERGLVVLAPR